MLQARHIVVIAGFLTATGAMMASLPGWEHLKSPLFVGGVLAQLGTALAGLYLKPPTTPPK